MADDDLTEAARLRVLLANLKAQVDDQIALGRVPATCANLEAARAKAAAAFVSEAARLARLSLARDVAKERRR